MYPKRFIQLFIIFFVTIFISLAIVDLFHVREFWLQGILVTIVGYIILIIPLTALTILKQRKKFSGQTDNDRDDIFNKTLSKLENVFVLATKASDGKLTASIVTFKQSTVNENVFYIVTSSNSERTANIAQNGVAALTTWYDKQTGARLSSKNVSAAVVADDQVATMLQEHPEIKALGEDFSNHVIIQLTCQSVLIESFRDQPVAVSF
ncbi:pyridoxamine 5'-phosphate oxidase family protein [Weissella paramesenteroides]|uniref:pyridoxamine 5'-phosphate oxidase family protein n=1 Tax=Weissella paramesenteroides TaxID=1249 RepID=UPI0023A9726B|nr:pyridoxamine 5'-phosphate oxidase family protein [Weissella paramesenteroides]WEA53765.1 pyridoxamine 5'-phosphate oxidase family protein [Weissella paramesenteroides]